MSSTFDYAGKVALVTGAGAGIGRATALAFAKAGAKVAVCGRSEGNISETVELIEQSKGEAIAILADVSKEDEVEKVVKTTIKRFGRLDFAFNNAGVWHAPSSVGEMPSNVWNEIISTNLSSMLFCLKHEIPEMLKTGGGSIVNTSSGAGITGFPGYAAYCASKFGVIGVSKAAALDYAASNIRVNVVAPGYVDTPMMGQFTGGTQEGQNAAIAQEPVGRVGKPEEIAGTVLWLCSDLAAFTVGATFVVDGAQSL